MEMTQGEQDNCKQAQDELCRSGASINDLRDLYYSGKKMTKTQQQALSNYDRFRLLTLKECAQKESFHKKYMELQLLANLYSYEEFLKDKYIQ